MSMPNMVGVPLSMLDPKFLHTNSTSHTWPFSAIAELIDNAYDPDVMAKQLWIDWTRIKGFDCLTFQDNGKGMTKKGMHKMLSFGFSDKQAVGGHAPVGMYGNGFKSSSMRLGKDAIIFSKISDTMSVGLLSQSYLESIQAEHVVVPIVTLGHDGQSSVEDAASLQDILKHSPFNTEEELLTELTAITSISSTGTRIIIWNLRRVANGETEFDLSTNRYDIRIPEDACETHKNQNITQSVPEIIYSLRAYCSILYLKPRMQIIIRGEKVKMQLISKSLALTRKDQYKPVFLKERIPITFGYNIKNKDEYGMMMYRNNRLIKAFERVGCQRKGGFRGVGVIGVIECNFLKPTHNKQDFDDTDEYRKTMNNLAVKLEEYWEEIRHKRKGCQIPTEYIPKHPDQNWVQCDNCQRWRRLPDGIDSNLLPDEWFCYMNPDPQYRSCQVEQEPVDSEDEQQCDPKPYKRQ
nr:MORC family CW-type zinc finger protein 3-like isoform X1 [Paramormyrops kingsleyae]